ncbi:MAG TPA: alpha/beta hydrolase [Stellaceae bacterium]|jgi:pimeloyl-ACP methyl ester carboxylesterase|nr:alpha/beta hydrolase [Stellaceae bacterium]
MTAITARDGIKLYAESQGPEDGVPIVFVHELAGSCRAFDLQVRDWRAAQRCITFNARGYPPSEVPPNADSYSQGHAAADIGAIMDGFGLADAHIVGVSMGSASTLQYALRHPDRVRSITLTSIGSGSDLKPGEFAASMEALAELALSRGMRALAEHYAATPTRYRLQQKNPSEYRNFVDQLGAGSALGITNTMRGVQSKRAPLYAHKDRIAALHVPTLVVLGEEDEPCVKPSHFLKDVLPGARLEIVGNTGHCVNLEEPALYNRLVLGFIEGIEARLSENPAPDK